MTSIARRILSGIAVMLILCGISWADIAYTTSDGGLGLIKIRGARATSVDVEGIKYQGSNTNPLIAPYWDNGSSRVILIERTNDDTTSGDKAYTFNPSDLSKPLNTEAKTLNGIYDTQSAVYSYNGRGLFLSSGTKITQVNTSDLNFVRSYDASRDYGAVHDIVVHNDRIHALVDSGDTESALFTFDGQLTSDNGNMSIRRIRHRATSMALLNSRFSFAHSDGVYILDSVNISSDNPVASFCSDTGNGFYCLTKDSAGNSELMHYSATTSSFTRLFSGQSGESLKVIRDTSYNILGAVTGGTIRLYNMTDDTLIGTYDSATLGGTPLNMALTSSSGSDGSSGSSSGCNASGMGMIVAGLCALVMGRKRD